MAINRITPITVPSGGFQDWAYVENQPTGASMFDFVADGNEGTGTIANARYRILFFNDLGNFNLTFDRPGKVDYLVVGGGGSSGSWTQDNTSGQNLGGGGAGGFLMGNNYYLNNSSTTIVVGDGGNPGGGGRESGENSSFATFVAYGGGAGGANSNGTGLGGASGGGGNGSGAGGSSIVGQGNNGAGNATGGAGGGGGAGGAGGTGGNQAYGGPGLYRNFDGTWRWYAAGGNSGGTGVTLPEGQTPRYTNASISTPGCGGGGGYYDGGTGNETGYDGSKGIVLIRFRVA